MLLNGSPFNKIYCIWILLPHRLPKTNNSAECPHAIENEPDDNKTGLAKVWVDCFIFQIRRSKIMMMMMFRMTIMTTMMRTMKMNIWSLSLFPKNKTTNYKVRYVCVVDNRVRQMVVYIFEKILIFNFLKEFEQLIVWQRYYIIWIIILIF